MRRGLALVASKPTCASQQGIQDGLFYNFHNEAANFGVCEACYVGTITWYGMKQFFSETPKVVPGTAFCVFNPFLPRWKQYIDRFAEALYFGQFSMYEENVRKWLPIVSCAGRKGIRDQPWWGWPECTFCEECFESVGRGTKLVEQMPLQGKIMTNNMCCMYSER